MLVYSACNVSVGAFLGYRRLVAITATPKQLFLVCDSLEHSQVMHESVHIVLTN